MNPVNRDVIIQRCNQCFKNDRKADSTKERYMTHILSFLDYMGLTDSDSSCVPTIFDARDYLEFVDQEKLPSERTYNQIVCALRHLFTSAFLTPDIGSLLKTRRVPKTTRPFFLPQHTRILLEQCSDRRLRAAVALAVGCGLRISEVTSLQFKHIRKSNSFILIENSKWGRSRKVPYSDTAALVLNQYCISVKHRNPDDFVFPGKKPGTHIRNSTVTKQFSDYIQAFDFTLPSHSYHSLRHSYATELAMQRVPLPVIQELMGHSSAATTAQYIHTESPYSGVIPDVLKCIMNFEGK